MKTTKYYCDHCKKELDEMNDYVDMDIDLLHETVCVDLCKQCVELAEKEMYKFLCKKPSYIKGA